MNILPSQKKKIKNYRVASYVAAFRALFPHRLKPAIDMTAAEVKNEPLFYNRQVRRPNVHVDGHADTFAFTALI